MKILADRGDERKIIQEEKEEWLADVLLAMEIPKELFDLNIEDMKEYLSTINVEIWENHDETLDIYKNDEIVAQWKKPKLILIKDKPRWYYEIHINAWARPLQKLDI